MDIWGFQKGLNHYYLAFVHEKRREEIEAIAAANEVGAKMEFHFKEQMNGA